MWTFALAEVGTVLAAGRFVGVLGLPDGRFVGVLGTVLSWLVGSS